MTHRRSQAGMLTIRVLKSQIFTQVHSDSDLHVKKTDGMSLLPLSYCLAPAVLMGPMVVVAGWVVGFAARGWERRSESPVFQLQFAET